jgi:hypothetical protein
MQSLKKAFAVTTPADNAFSAEELGLMEKLAAQTMKRGVATPVILFLETFKPMQFIGSQALFFFKPILGLLADTAVYEKYAEILSRRGSVETFLTILERYNREKARQ